MNSIVTILEALLTAEQVISREHMADTLVQPLTHTTLDGSLPEAVVYPQTEAELSETMACAHQHGWRVLPFGSGSKVTWGGLASGFDVAICTQRLNTIVEHAIGDMTLTAAAGLTLADLAPQLAQQNQFLAVDPAFPGQATLGGIVATADTGALRQRYNSVRDMLIGISFVRYDGQVAKAGGRVVKNVAGYDLMKLMTGAYGSLGIISQLTFRLYPQQAASKTVVVSGSAEAMAQLTANLRRSSLTPVALDLLSPSLTTALGFDQTVALAAQFQSIAPGVEEQVQLLSTMAEGHGCLSSLAGDEDTDFWHQENAILFPTSATHGDGLETTFIAKLGILPASAVDVLTKINDQVPQAGLARIHAGSGIGTLRMPAEGVTPNMVQTLRQVCEASGGYFTLLQAPKALKQSVDVWGYRGNALSLMRGIKEKFDPQGILNPGRYIG